MSVLLVSEGSPHAIEAALQNVTFTRLESVTAARSVVEDDPPSVLVVDDSSLDDETTALLQVVRALDDVVPVVYVASDPDNQQPLRSVDRLVIRPFEPATLRTAVEQAHLVGEYDAAIGQLFERAKARAVSTDGPSTNPEGVQQLRQDADALLTDLVAYDDPGLLASLFTEPTTMHAEE